MTSTFLIHMPRKAYRYPKSTVSTWTQKEIFYILLTSLGRDESISNLKKLIKVKPNQINKSPLFTGLCQGMTVVLNKGKIPLVFS